MLAALLNVPRDGADWNRWAFDHADSVKRINAAIAAQGGPVLPEAPLYPVSFDPRQWLQWVQQAHNAFTTALGQQGEDLQDVDLEDLRERSAWINLVYQECFDAEQALGL